MSCCLCRRTAQSTPGSPPSTKHLPLTDRATQMAEGGHPLKMLMAQICLKKENPTFPIQDCLIKWENRGQSQCEGLTKYKNTTPTAAEQPLCIKISNEKEKIIFSLGGSHRR